MVDVSVIIVNYNTCELTASCVVSIMEKTKGVTYEVIIVDNASRGHDAAVLSSRFPQAKILANSENEGFAKGNNRGIAAAQGRNILLLNSDTVLLNDAISLALLALERSRAAVVTGALFNPDGTLQHNCQAFPSIRLKLFELLRLQKLVGRRRAGSILFGSFFDYDSEAHPGWVWGTFFLFPRQILDMFPDGKLHEDFFMYGEDMQWCMHLKRCGQKVLFTPKAKILHLMGKSGGAKSGLMIENGRIFMKTYYSAVERGLLALLDLLLQMRKN